MNQNKNILTIVALGAALLATGTTVSSAAGLLGQRYVDATFDYVAFETAGLDDGKGFTIDLNHPLNDSIDLGLTYSHARSDSSTVGSDVRGQELLGTITVFGQSQGMKPYLRGGLGWARVSAGNLKETDGIYLVEIGLEFAACEKVTVTPFVNVVDGLDQDIEHTYNYGLVGEFELDPKWSLLARTSLDDDENWQSSLGVLFRF